MTRISRLAAALALAVVAALLAPGAAHAAGFQFWGFYQLSADEEWGFASEGAGTTVPEDGAVEGFRFAVSSGEDVRVPRAVLTFEDICADTPAVDGMKRVGLVVDPGRDADAPEGETPFTPGAQCAVVEPDTTSQEILAQAAGEIRTDASGLICGIGGYPAAAGCGDEIAEPTEAQLAEDDEIEIAVVPAGQPIIAAPEDGGDQTTDEPTSTDEETSPEETTDAATEDDTADDEATEDEPGATEDEATKDESAAEETTGDDGPTEEDSTETGTDEATDDADADESGGGLAPWVWIAGVVVLLGVLAWAASAARNRRLEEVERAYEPGPGTEGLDDDQTPDGSRPPGGPQTP